MKDKFLKAAAITPDIKVGDTDFNTENIIKSMNIAHKQGVKLAVFPELVISGYTCSDLFLQDILLRGSLDGLKKIINASENLDMITIVGLPFLFNFKLYNVAAIIFDGELLGIVPKQHIPNYSEFYEARHFSTGNKEVSYIEIPELGDTGSFVPFGANQLFKAENLPELVIGIDICEDLWMPIPPSCYHAMASATVIANLSASDETTGKDLYRRELVKNQSARLVSGYIYADAGEGESSTDLVFAGHNLIAETEVYLLRQKDLKTVSQ